MRLFTNDEAVIAEGAVYLRIVAPSYLFSSVTMVYLNIMRSVERVVVSTVVFLVSLLANIALNALFIFGLLGLPAMGIAGAALATACARLIELILVLVYAHWIKTSPRVEKRVRLRFSRHIRAGPSPVRGFHAVFPPRDRQRTDVGAGHLDERGRHRPHQHSDGGRQRRRPGSEAARHRGVLRHRQRRRHSHRQGDRPKAAAKRLWTMESALSG